MSSWRSVKLGEVATIKHGWPFQSEYLTDQLAGKPIVVSIGNFKYTGGFRFDETTLREYTGEYPNEYLLSVGDVLLIMTCQTEGGEILGIPGIIPNDGRKYLHNQRLGKLIVNSPESVSQRFLYWYFLTKEFNYQLVGSASGTKIVHTAPTRIESCEILLPPLPEQKAIAAVLSSLDDKINLLHRQNKTLAAMAETLFRQWFVEEAQEDWNAEKLGDCVTISYGKNLPTKNLLNEGFPVFGANGQIGCYERYTYEEPQVLVSCRGEASGKVNISFPKSFVTNNSLVLERNKKPGISFEYLKYWALYYDFTLHVSGSAQPQITIDGLYDAEFIFPDSERITRFTDAVSPVEKNNTKIHCKSAPSKPSATPCCPS